MKKHGVGEVVGTEGQVSKTGSADKDWTEADAAALEEENKD